MTTLRPLWGNVLIRELPRTNVTKSGIQLPDQPQNTKTLRGTIIAAGDGSVAFDGTLVPMKVAVGDVVLFKTYEAEETNVNGERMFLVDQRQILSTIFEN